MTTLFTPQDKAKFSRFHLRSILTTGMGVFADGYDLSSISVVLPLILTSFGIKKLDGLESSLLTGSALAGAAIGALVFGQLANKGRKRYYGIDVTLMAVAGLAQAFVPNIMTLIVVRFILGLGVGADYTLSPMIMGEHANAKDRGKSMALGFGVTWVIGAAVSAFLDLLLTTMGASPDLVWRIVLGVSAVFPASVIYLRRKMPETTRYLARIADDSLSAKKIISEIDGVTEVVDTNGSVKDDNSISYYVQRSWKRFFAPIVLWFLFDIVAYSGILFGPSLIAKGLGLSAVSFSLLNTFLFTVPGALVGLSILDRIGRRPVQIIGFLGMAGALLAFGLYSRSSAAMVPAIGLLLYGMQNLFSQGGPGSVSASGLLGVELTPTKARGFVQGLTVAGGRVGATIAAFVFPALFKAYGESFAIYFLAVIAALAAVLTLILVPETKGLSLEESSADVIIIDGTQVPSFVEP